VELKEHLPHLTGANAGMAEIQVVAALCLRPILDEEDLAPHQPGNPADVLTVSRDKDVPARTLRSPAETGPEDLDIHRGVGSEVP
jgi:hypothetical protein